MPPKWWTTRPGATAAARATSRRLVAAAPLAAKRCNAVVRIRERESTVGVGDVQDVGVAEGVERVGGVVGVGMVGDS